MDSNYADLPDALWDRIKVWIPTEAPNPKGGQRPIDDRRVMSGIIYRLRTGCQWDAMPAEFGSGSTLFSPILRAGAQLESSAMAHCRDAHLTTTTRSASKVGLGVARQRQRQGTKRGDLTGPQSDRSRKTRHQTPCPDRRPGHPVGGDAHGGKHPRHAHGRRDARSTRFRCVQREGRDVRRTSAWTKVRLREARTRGSRSRRQATHSASRRARSHRPHSR